MTPTTLCFIAVLLLQSRL